jgi:hypothetical protein
MCNCTVSLSLWEYNISKMQKICQYRDMNQYTRFGIRKMVASCLKILGCKWLWVNDMHCWQYQNFSATRLGKLMNVNLCFSFKLSKRNGVFGLCMRIYIRRINDCNECHTQKRQEPPNVGKLGTTRIMTASARYVASGARIRKLQAFLFLLDWVYTAVKQFLSCRN